VRMGARAGLAVHGLLGGIDYRQVSWLTLASQ